jgi:hypothetical protein
MCLPNQENRNSGLDIGEEPIVQVAKNQQERGRSRHSERLSPSGNRTNSHGSPTFSTIICAVQNASGARANAAKQVIAGGCWIVAVQTVERQRHDAGGAMSSQLSELACRSRIMLRRWTSVGVFDACLWAGPWSL